MLSAVALLALSGVALGISVLVYAVRSAQHGYEDETGFHPIPNRHAVDTSVAAQWGESPTAVPARLQR